MAKLDIDFILLDESKVRYGFRALMAGAELEDFKKNPVMLLQHNRPKEYVGKDDIMLPIGSWYDIRVEGNQLLAKPDFDDDDEIAMKVQKKVQKKYLNGVSVWIDPLVVSDDPADMLPGQSLPTFTKWEILEASIVDIPNCKNALAIRNSAGKRIELSGSLDADIVDQLNKLSQKNPSINFMDRKLLCAKLGLPESATDAQISDALTAIKLSADSSGQMATENTSLKALVSTLKLAATEKLNADLVDGAVSAGKILAGDREKYLKLAGLDFETTKELLDGITPAESIQSRLSNENAGNELEVAELMKLSGNQLYMDGKLDRLKEIAPERFKLKYKEAFGTEFSGK